MHGFLRDFNGRLAIRGRDIREFQRDEIAKLLSVVEQGGALVDGSIYENISLGNPNLSRERCFELLLMLDLGHLARTIDELDRPVDDRGGEVSGGERQRIAIARAIATDVPILVLDEVTANLNASSEGAVLDSVRKIWRNRTVLMMTHHLHIAESADQVVFLQKGFVLASGSHKQCLAASAEYRGFVSWSDGRDRQISDNSPLEVRSIPTLQGPLGETEA